MARTAKVCAPSLSAARVLGEVQAFQLPPSTLHSKLAPVSGELNPKVGVLSLVGPVGPEVMLVSGPAVSTLKLRLAGL